MADASRGKPRRGAPAQERAAVERARVPGRRRTPLSAATMPGPRSDRSVSFTVAGVVLVLAALVLLLRLSSQERGGPAHGELSLGDGLPATLYLPTEATDDGGLPVPLPPGERPPVIVVAHGYSADRASMSGMARSLAHAGYAVLSIDLRGHGANTAPFKGDLHQDLTTAVDWAQTSPYVDGTNIAVLGHSMGATAALDFASLDDRIEAVVPVSGGGHVNDEVVPARTLLLVASGDPGRIADRQAEVAEQLRDAGGIVVEEEIGGTDHITILRNDRTIAAITEFLDPVLGVDRPDGEVPGIVDPRYRTALLYLIVVLGLTAMLGSVAARLVPAGPTREPVAPVWTGFVLVAGSLVLTLPLVAAGGFDLLPIGAGQTIVMHLLLASGLLWGTRTLARRGELPEPVATWLGDRQWMPWREVGGAGLAAGAGIFVLLVPFSGVFHRLVPTPTRAVYWVVISLAALPFFAAFETLLRRGSPLAAAGWGALGRIVLLAALALGVGIDALPGVVALVAPLLVLQYVLLELFAAGAYVRARNPALIAVVDAVVVGWMATALTPVG